MDKKDIVNYWDSEAKESLQVAQHLFFGHLAIEKLLKSIYVNRKDVDVPRTHNLARIAKAANLKTPVPFIVI